jgi:hypothetical protein
VVEHAGGMSGVATQLWLVPEENVAVVVLFNTETIYRPDWNTQILRQILAALLPGKIEASVEVPESEEKPFRPDPSLQGTWKGQIHTYSGKSPLVLKIKESGDVHARVGEQLWTLLNDTSFQKGFLRGRMQGDIRTEDANRRQYLLHLKLKLRENKLNGSITAISDITRRGNALTSWVELQKEN